MKIEYDFTRPNQPDDPGVEAVQAINRTRYVIWGLLVVCVLSLAALAWSFTVNAYPTLKKTDRFSVCSQEVK